MIHGRSTRVRVWLAALLLGMVAGAFAPLGVSPAAATSTAEQSAVNWATGQLQSNPGNSKWLGHCLGFDHAAYTAAGVNLPAEVSVSWGSGTYPDDIWGHFTGGTTGAGTTPPVGALVFYSATATGHDHTYSHVALSVGGGNTISTSDKYNGGLHYETIAQHMSVHPYNTYVGWWLPDGTGGTSTGSSLSDGSFVSYAGRVYRLAGGAPIYVSTWDHVGGPQPTTGLSDAQWSSLRQRPANGTFISGQPSGRVYIVAGGAPLYLSTFTGFGSPTVIEVDDAAIQNAGGGDPWQHLAARPANGTELSTKPDGRVYTVAGGAPIYTHTCTPSNDVNLCNAVVNVDEWDINNISNPIAHLSARPAEGTVLRGAQNGGIYTVAGGAPIWVSACQPSASINLCNGLVNVDQSAIDNPTDPRSHLNDFPAPGTFISGNPSGAVYRVIDHGSYFYVSSWAPYPGHGAPVQVSDGGINVCSHLNCNPFGDVNSVVGGNGTVTVTGWAMDPNTSDPVKIKVTAGEAKTTITANASRPDVDAVFHRGANFGFKATVPATAGAQILVCATGVNAGPGSDTLLKACVHTAVALPSTAATRPGRVRHLRLRRQGERLRITWKRAKGPVTRYVIEVGHSRKVITGSRHSVTFHGLRHRRYRLSIVAFNKSEKGPISKTRMIGQIVDLRHPSRGEVSGVTVARPVTVRSSSTREKVHSCIDPRHTRYRALSLLHWPLARF
jgi:hypothetical protein